MKHIAIIAFVVVMALIAGCTDLIGVHGQNPAAAMTPVVNHELQRGEIMNMTVVRSGFPSNGIEFPLPDGAGKYHIYTATNERGKAVEGGYRYDINEPITDRFGTKDNFVTHGWRVLAPGGDGFLGMSNDNSVMNTSFSVPKEAVHVTLTFVTFTEGEDLTVFDVIVTEES